MYFVLLQWHAMVLASSVGWMKEDALLYASFNYPTFYIQLTPTLNMYTDLGSVIMQINGGQLLRHHKSVFHLFSCEHHFELGRSIIWKHVGLIVLVEHLFETWSPNTGESAFQFHGMQRSQVVGIVSVFHVGRWAWWKVASLPWLYILYTCLR